MADESAEVVVVGGGAMGTSVAWHLRELGVEDVVLLERDSLASGSTSKSAGGIRTQFADELNVRIALRSLDELERMEGIGFRQHGYLFLLSEEDDVRRFQAALALQHSLGVPSRELSVTEALELVPQLEPEGLLAATFCDLDGYATPEAVVGWYARGVDVRQGCAATRVVARRGRVVAVETTRGRIATGTVVCCCGAWSRELAATAGVDLPVEGERRWMFFTPQDGGLPERLPLTIDFSTGFYFHREGRGLVFGGREQTLEELAGPAARRLPVLLDLPVRSSWWGYYELSPDRNAIVGEAAEPARFLYATGFSGHGFQQAPAVGEHVAELVAGRTPTLDLSAFALDRFGRGERRPEAFVV
ncbi:MAG TPA: FAD-binding oxidoreductase [Gaiellaceae bacterium]|nr:FAD-binding oxidoreductase [Gaiellaceae bacterium]